MERIDTSGRAIDLYGPGKDGFKSGAILGSKFLNEVQEAIVLVIEAAGLTPSADLAQFLKALDIRYGQTRALPFRLSGFTDTFEKASTAAESALFRGLKARGDGTNLYGLASTGDIYQYQMSTAHRVGTASYQSKTFDTLISIPYDIDMSADGTKAYVLDATSQTIEQFDLSVAWDISTAASASKNLSVAGQEASPRGFRFSSDGTKVYVIGQTQYTVFQYTCSTPWDISTASYASKSYDVTAQEAIPQELEIAPDGSRFFIKGDTNDTIYEYSMSTPFDIATASYTGNARSVINIDDSIQGMSISSSGNVLYMIGSQFDQMYQVYVNQLVGDV